MKKKLRIIPMCPRCSSLRTGIICNYITTQKEQKKIKKKYLEQGCFIKFVSPEKYRTYYSAQKVYYFCDECDYEFRGNERIKKVELEEYEQYLEERQIDEELIMYNKKALNSMIRIIKRLKPVQSEE